jgi:hypothetical protein
LLATVQILALIDKQRVKLFDWQIKHHWQVNHVVEVYGTQVSSTFLQALACEIKHWLHAAF